MGVIGNEAADKAIERGRTHSAGRPSNPRNQPLVRLEQRHKRVADLMASGMTDKRVCAQTGFSRRSLSIWRASPLFQDYYAQRKAELVEIGRDAEITCSARAMAVLDEGAIRAAEKLVDLVEHKDDRIARQACMDVLGLALPKNEGATQPGLVINAETVQLFQTVIAESDGVKGCAKPSANIPKFIPSQAGAVVSRAVVHPASPPLIAAQEPQAVSA